MEKESGLRYFGVKLIKEIAVTGSPDPSLIDEDYCEDNDRSFEESVLLIAASSQEDACECARKLAKKDEVKYQNKYNQDVIWKFVRVVGCFQIMDKLSSGAEVYSQLYSDYDNARRR